MYSGEKREFNAGQFFADLFTVGLEAVAFGGAAKGLRNAETASWCFVAGTLIATEDGQKPIEEIQAGDKVLSENPETGEVAYKTVEETYENETTELVHVFVNGEEIITTPSHPFYVPKLGWTLAIKLRAGDILVLSNGEYVVVEAIQHELLESPIKVYNFEVEDFHTYFVGESSVLVHNTCETERVNPNDIRFSQSSVNGSTEIVESMKKNGWVGDPIDVVRMPDNIYTTIDNTKVVAARQAGIDVQANIHAYDELLPAEYIERFTTKKGVPATWGDAIKLRIGKQNSTFRNNNPFGSYNMNNIK